MKRLITALIITALAVSICFSGSSMINKYSNELRELIEESIEACSDGEYERTNKINDKIIEKWEHHSRLLELFSGHLSIHAVGQSIEKMKALLEIEDYPLYIVECRTAILEIKNISRERIY